MIVERFVNKVTISSRRNLCLRILSTIFGYLQTITMLTNLLVAPGCEWFGFTLVPPLCACIGMSCGNLYLSLNVQSY